MTWRFFRGLHSVFFRKFEGKARGCVIKRGTELSKRKDGVVRCKNNILTTPPCRKIPFCCSWRKHMPAVTGMCRCEGISPCTTPCSLIWAGVTNNSVHSSVLTAETFCSDAFTVLVLGTQGLSPGPYTPLSFCVMNCLCSLSGWSWQRLGAGILSSEPLQPPDRSGWDSFSGVFRAQKTWKDEMGCFKQ